MSFTSLRRTLTISAGALCLGACAIPPNPQSSTLTPEERARTIAAISHFMSDGDVDSFDSVSKGFDVPLYENERITAPFGHTVDLEYRGFQKRSDAFSMDSTYTQIWKYESHKRPTVSSSLYLLISHNFCLTRDGFRQAFGDQVDPRGDGGGKFSGLATNKNLAMVTFTDDGSCVKSFNIFARHESVPKATATESH
jgi:hypothetical protein